MDALISSLVAVQVERYIVNPPEIKLSLWSGDVVLHNVELRVDALTPLLFGEGAPAASVARLARAFVRELRIRVPWTALASQPVVLSLDSIELSFVASAATVTATAATASSLDDAEDHLVDLLLPSETSAEVPVVPSSSSSSSSSSLSWANGALVRKVLSNVSLVVSNLIVKYVDDDVGARASIFCRAVRLHSASTPQWRPAFVPPGHASLLQKVLTVDDLSFAVESTAPPAAAALPRRVAPPPIVDRLCFEARLQSVGDVRAATAVDVRIGCVRAALALDQFSLLHRLAAQLLLRLPARADAPGAAEQPVDRPAAELEPAPATTPQTWSAWAWDVVMPAAPPTTTAHRAVGGAKSRRSHSVSVFLERLDVAVFAHTALAPAPGSSTALASLDDDPLMGGGFVEQHHRRASVAVVGDVAEAARSSTPTPYDPFGGAPLLLHASVSLFAFRRQTVAMSDHKLRRWFVGVDAAALRSTSPRDGQLVDVVSDGAGELTDVAHETAVRAQQQHSLFGAAATVYADGDDLPLPDASAAAAQLGVDGMRAVDVFAEHALATGACRLFRFLWQRGGSAASQLDVALGRPDGALLLRLDSDLLERFWKPCVFDVASLYAMRSPRRLASAPASVAARVHVTARVGALALHVRAQSGDGVVSVVHATIDGASAATTATFETALRLERAQCVAHRHASSDATATPEPFLTPLDLAASLVQRESGAAFECGDGGAGVTLTISPSQCDVLRRTLDVWWPVGSAASALPTQALALRVQGWSVRGGGGTLDASVAHVSATLEGVAAPLLAVDGIGCKRQVDALHVGVRSVQSCVDLPALAPWLAWASDVAASRMHPSVAPSVPSRLRLSFEVASAAVELAAGDARLRVRCETGVRLAASGALACAAVSAFLDEAAPLLDVRRVNVQLGAETAVVVGAIASTVREQDVAALVALATAMPTLPRASAEPRPVSVTVGELELVCVPAHHAALPERYVVRAKRLALAPARSSLGALEIDCDASADDLMDHRCLLRWPTTPTGDAVRVQVGDDGVRVASAPLSAVFCAAHLLHAAPMLGAALALARAVPRRQASGTRALVGAELGAIELRVSSGVAHSSVLHVSVGGVRLVERELAVADVAARWQRSADEHVVVLPPTSVRGSVADGGVLRVQAAVRAVLTIEALEHLLRVDKLARRALRLIRAPSRRTGGGALFGWRLVCDEARLTLADDAGAQCSVVTDLLGVALDSSVDGSVRVAVASAAASVASDAATASLLHVARAPEARPALLTAVYSAAQNDLTIDVDPSATLSVRLGLLALGVVARIAYSTPHAALENRRVVRESRALLERLAKRPAVGEADLRVRVLAGAAAIDLHDTRSTLRLTATQCFALRASHDPRPSRDDSVSLQCSLAGVRAVWLEADAATPLTTSPIDVSLAVAYGARGIRVDASTSAVAVRLDSENAVRVATTAVAFVDALLTAYGAPDALPRAPPVPSQFVTDSLAAFRWPTAAERADCATVVDFDANAAAGIGAELSDVDGDSRASVERQRARRSSVESRLRHTKPARLAALVDVAAHESEARVWLAFRLAERRVLHEVRLAAAASAPMLFELVACERWDSLQRCFAPLESSRGGANGALRVTAVGGSRLASSAYRLLVRVASAAGSLSVDCEAVRAALARVDVQLRSEAQPALQHTLRLSLVSAALSVTVDDERARTRLLKAACGSVSPLPPRSTAPDDAALFSAALVAPAVRVRSQRSLPLDSRAGVAVTCARGRVDVHAHRRVRSVAMFEHVSATVANVGVASDEPSVSAGALLWRVLVRCGAVAFTADPASVTRVADAAALMRRAMQPWSLVEARLAAQALLPFSVLVANATNVAFELRVGVNAAEIEPHAFVPLAWSVRGEVPRAVQLRARVVVAANATVVTDVRAAALDVASGGFKCAAFPFGDVWVHVAHRQRAVVLTLLGSLVVVNETGVSLDCALQSSTPFTGLASNMRALAPCAGAADSLDAVHAAAFAAGVRGVVCPLQAGIGATRMLLRATGAWDWSAGVLLSEGDTALDVDADVRLSASATANAPPLPQSTRLLVFAHVARLAPAAPLVVRLLPPLTFLNSTPWWLVCRALLSGNDVAVVATVAPGARAQLQCGAADANNAVLHFSAWIDGCHAVENAAGALPLAPNNWTLLSVPGETTPHCACLRATQLAPGAWQCELSVPTLVRNRTALRLFTRGVTDAAPAFSLAPAPRERDGVGVPVIRVDGMPVPVLAFGQVDDVAGAVVWADAAVAVAHNVSTVVPLVDRDGASALVVVTCVAVGSDRTLVDVDGWLVVVNDSNVPLSLWLGAQVLRVEPRATTHCTTSELVHTVSLGVASAQTDDDDDDIARRSAAEAVPIRLVASDEPLRVAVGAHALQIAVASLAPSSSVCVRVAVDERPPLSVRNTLDRELWFRVVDDEGATSPVLVPARATRPVATTATARDSAVALLRDEASAGGDGDEAALVRNAIAVASSAASIRPQLAEVGLRGAASGDVEWSVPFAARLPGRWSVAVGDGELLRVRVLFDGASRIVLVERAEREPPPPAKRPLQAAVAAQCDLCTVALLDDNEHELLAVAVDEIETVFARLAPPVSVSAALANGSGAAVASGDARFSAAPLLYHGALSAAAFDVGVHDNRVELGVLARATRPTLLAATLSGARDVVACRVQLPPLALAVEDLVVRLHLQPLQRQFLDALASVLPAAPAAAATAAAPLVHVQQLSVSAIEAQVSVRAHEPVAVGFDRFPLALTAVELHDVRVRAAPLLRAALLHYAQHALQRAPAVLGSLDLLGNPTGMLRELNAGVRDAVLLPLDGVRRLSPSGFAVGLVRGLGSLVQHVAIGGFASISALSLGVARNLDPAGGGGPLMGLMRGVSGLVSEPVRGARAGGVNGAAAGLARGVLGVAARPIGGLFEWVGLASGDALTSVGGERAQRPRRVPVAPWRASAAHLGALLADRAQLGADEPLLLVARARLVSTSAHSEVPCTLLASARRLFVVHDDELLLAVELARLHVPRYAAAGALLRLQVDDGAAHAIELRAHATAAAVAQHANDVDLDEFVRELGALQQRRRV